MTESALELTPVHREFGARVQGVDLALPLDDASFAAIEAAVNRHSFLLFENQSMSDAVQLDFTRRFGAPEEEHVSYYGQGKITYIGLVGNVDADGKRVTARRVKSARGNEMWHSDSSFREIPAMYSILAAHEVPDEGGETEFASARAAWKRLDAETRALIHDRVGVHDYIYSRTKMGENAVNQSQRKFMRPVRQRLVRQNPVTGDRSVFVGSHVKEIEGMPDDEARALIARLIAEVTRADSVYRHRWRAGDFVIWDNRCLLHRGVGYDEEKYRRRMHQTRVRCPGPSLGEPLDPL